MQRLGFTILTIIFICACISNPTKVGDKYPIANPNKFDLFLENRINSTKDIFAKSTLYKKWLAAFDSDLTEDARAQIANRWVAETELVTNKSIKGQILLEIAQSAVKIRNGDVSKKLFYQSFADLFENDDLDKYSDELSIFIQACFSNIELVRELIRSAVFKVLTLTDDWKKTFVLTELASFYTEKGEGGIQVLLQHAIANASGIQNPFLKAESFARIASGFESLKLGSDAETYWTQSKEIFEDLNILTLSESDSESLTRTLQFYLKKGLIPEVNANLSLLSDQNQRAEIVAGLATYYANHNQTLLFRVNTQKIATTLQGPNGLEADALFRQYAKLFGQVAKQEDKDFVFTKIRDLASSTTLAFQVINESVKRLAESGDFNGARTIISLRKQDYANLLLTIASLGDTKAEKEISALGPGSQLSKDLLAPWALIEAGYGNTGTLRLAYSNIKSESDAVDFIAELYRILRANKDLNPKLDEIFDAVSPDSGTNK